MKLEDIKNLKVTIMGLGLNGGGLTSAKFFAKHGAKVTVTDLKSEEELKPSIQALKDIENIRFVLGRHDIEDFETADLVIKNPVVKRIGNKYLEKAKIFASSEIDYMAIDEIWVFVDSDMWYMSEKSKEEFIFSLEVANKLLKDCEEILNNRN